MTAHANARAGRVFLTSTMRTSFIERDVATLKKHFDVDVFIGHGALAATTVLRRARTADVSVSWFASVYTFFMIAGARARKRPTMIILGGVDTARDNDIGYGIWRSRWRRPLLRWSLRNATRIFAVDHSLTAALTESSGLTDLNIHLLPTGYDTAYWTPGAQKQRRVVCVAACTSRERVLVKGVDIFVEMARSMPDVSFELVGTDSSLLSRFNPPANLTIIPFLDRDALRERYRSAAVYCQPSRHEGLPNALCEAMLCGCVPVATDVGGSADLIGDCGIVALEASVEACIAALDAALRADSEIGSRARQRVVEHFPEHVREARLIAEINELLNA